MKGTWIIIPTDLKQQVLDQLHTSHMGIEETKLLRCESIYWVNINTDIEKHIKNCNTCLEFQQTQPKAEIMHHEIPHRPWEVLGADVFHFNNKNYLCIVDYHSKCPVVKRTDNLIATAKVIFAEYGIPQKLMSDAGTNFVSDKFRKFCRSSTLSRQCCQHITIKVMGRLKPALNSLNIHLKHTLIPVGTSPWCYYKSILPH